MKEDIHAYEERLSNVNGLLTARKSLPKACEYRQKIRVAQNIIDGIYDDYDEVSGCRNQYQIHYATLVRRTHLLYTADMEICL